tara:strand:+ start:848 stop:1240 length:393 start_codon:yes stop_codon:yes gene_type:complete
MFNILFLYTILFFKTVEAIPINSELDNWKTIKLYDHREISSNEYEIFKTNMNTNTFIGNIVPIPLAVNEDIVCEKDFGNNNYEVVIISCETWNEFYPYFFTDYYKECNIKRNSFIFGNIIEYNESINKKC